MSYEYESEDPEFHKKGKPLPAYVREDEEAEYNKEEVKLDYKRKKVPKPYPRKLPVDRPEFRKGA